MVVGSSTRVSVIWDMMERGKKPGMSKPRAAAGNRVCVVVVMVNSRFLFVVIDWRRSFSSPQRAFFLSHRQFRGLQLAFHSAGGSLLWHSLRRWIEACEQRARKAIPQPDSGHAMLNIPGRHDHEIPVTLRRRGALGTQG